MVATKCDCKGWKKSINPLNSGLTMASARGYQYTGDDFKFCPWCGKELMVDEKR